MLTCNSDNVTIFKGPSNYENAPINNFRHYYKDHLLNGLY